MKKKIKVLNECSIITNPELIEQINAILNEYLYKIEELQNSIKIEDIVGALYVYAELYEYLIDKEKWNTIIRNQFIRLKECIEEDNLLNGMALFGGLCEVGLAIYLYSKKTGHYNHFWEKINEIILETTAKIVKEYSKNMDDLLIYQYDCVRGLSGILNYILYVDSGNDENKIIIEDVLRYLIKITKRKLVNGKKVPGWHIKNENQIREDEKIRFQNGNFDFGVAHGIAGPLAVMSIAYQKGYCIRGQKEAILTIIEEYERLALRFKDCTFWQGQYSFEDYLQSNQDNLVHKNKMSWCYGPIGILRALKLAGAALGSQQMEERGQKNIYVIAEMLSKDYCLDSPIICHGYAGLMTLFTIEYKECANRLLKEKINELADKIVKEYSSDFKFGFKHIETFYQDGQAFTNELFGNEFLYGASGIILSLISLIKADTNWEIHLLAK